MYKNVFIWQILIFSIDRIVFDFEGQYETMGLLQFRKLLYFI